VEDLINVPVNDHSTWQLVRIGSPLTRELREWLIDFLSKNQDIFVWKHEDMLNINTDHTCIA
jgi:hypothetical protein